MVREGKGPGLVQKEAPPKFETDKPVGECQSIRVLKSNPDPKQGMALLVKIATLMAPIMRRHDWQLPELCEFFPDNPNLLGMNVNRGRKILIRLRPSHAPDTFMDLESSLIGTMLHELTHNVHGPHDQQFYAFLDKLQDEYDHLRASGYSGEGFLSAGSKLSTERHDAHVPLHLARQRALEQAEKRRKAGLLMGPAGGQKLGGASSRAGKSQRELMLEAAERRMRDDKQCHGDAAEVEKEAAKAAREAIVVDLSSSSSDEEEGPDALVASSSKVPPPTAKRSSSDSDSDIELLSGPSPARPPVPAAKQATKRKPESPPKPPPPLKQARSARTWACAVCTFASNSVDALSCEMCDTLRPSATDLVDRRDRDVWQCHECGEWTSHERWSCTRCLAIKLVS